MDKRAYPLILFVIALLLAPASAFTQYFVIAPGAAAQRAVNTAPIHMNQSFNGSDLPQSFRLYQLTAQAESGGTGAGTIYAVIKYQINGTTLGVSAGTAYPAGTNNYFNMTFSPGIILNPGTKYNVTLNHTGVTLLSLMGGGDTYAGGQAQRTDNDWNPHTVDLHFEFWGNTTTPDVEAPIASITAPSEGALISPNSTNASVYGSDDIGVANKTIYGNWTSAPFLAATVTSPTNATNSTFNLTGIPEGTHTFYARVCDTSNNCTVTVNRTFTADGIEPSITEANTTALTESMMEGNPLTFWALVSDAHLSQVWLQLSNGTNLTASGTSGNYSVSYGDIANGNYNHTWWANDSVGNLKKAGPYRFDVLPYQLIIAFSSATSGNVTATNTSYVFTGTSLLIVQRSLPVGNVKVMFNNGKQLYEYYNNWSTSVNTTLQVVNTVYSSTWTVKNAMGELIPGASVRLYTPVTNLFTLYQQGLTDDNGQINLTFIDGPTRRDVVADNYEPSTNPTNRPTDWVAAPETVVLTPTESTSLSGFLTFTDAGNINSTTLEALAVANTPGISLMFWQPGLATQVISTTMDTLTKSFSYTAVNGTLQTCNDGVCQNQTFVRDTVQPTDIGTEAKQTDTTLAKYQYLVMFLLLVIIVLAVRTTFGSNDLVPITFLFGSALFALINAYFFWMFGMGLLITVASRGLKQVQRGA